LGLCKPIGVGTRSDRGKVQRDIVEQIIDQSGDYVLGLKGNQGSLHEATEDFFKELRATPTLRALSTVITKKPIKTMAA
jgi:predicted transposase YbfD/YdcC